MALQKELKSLIAIIKTGATGEVKLAQRRVESLWNKACQDDAARLKFAVFLDEACNLDRVSDVDHQAYFINTLKWPLYFAPPESFPAWTQLLIKWVVHPEGKIRIAAVKASHYLGVSMVSAFDEPCSFVNEHLPQSTRDFARNCFCLFALHVDSLLPSTTNPASTVLSTSPRCLQAFIRACSNSFVIPCLPATALKRFTMIF